MDCLIATINGQKAKRAAQQDKHIFVIVCRTRTVSIGASFPILLEYVMSLANACLIVAGILPVLTIGAAKFSARGAKRYDNHQPRAWAEGLEGWAARAHAAQLNGFEALPLFIAGVLAAQQAGIAQGEVDAYAAGFIAFRVLYTLAYLKDWSSLRSLFWFAACACSVRLLVAAI